MSQNCTFQILTPQHSQFGNAFARSRFDLQLHHHLMASMQKLRGRVYLKDQAIQPWELDDEGRFRMQGDEQSWHLLLVDDEKEVIGCARYLVHTNQVPYERLRVSQCALAKDATWGGKLRAAVELHLQQAQEENLSFVEVGGWALAEEWRNTRAALEILVGSFALGDLWGGCIGFCMATVRHGSSSMLRRIGGTSLEIAGETVPSYEDPEYGCTMEFLRFDYRSPAKRFMPFINQLKGKIAKSPLICASPVGSKLFGRLGAPEYLPEHASVSDFSPAFN